MKKSKKAVALFTTLGLISLISLMIMNSFGLMTKSFKHVENIEKINQGKVVISDIENVLSVITKNIKDSDTLNMILGAYPPISDEDGMFSLTIEMESMSKAININSIIEDYNSSTPNRILDVKDKYFPIFEFIFNNYQIRDRELFLNYILDSLDEDVVERDLDTEIVLNDVMFLNGLIVNETHFNSILKKYQEKSDDEDIFNIPWQDFFYFSYSKYETMIDCTFMKRNLADSMDLQIFESGDIEEISSEESLGSQEISCEMIDDNENVSVKNIYKVKAFENNNIYLVKGVISYSTNIVNDSFKFIYDLKSKKVIDIEIKTTSF